uniref:YeeE/YedE family protein n=1 Tax=Caldiarchaeum subterraneum TaxID=311458 RepID=A0A7J3WBZ9_CALS0
MNKKVSRRIYASAFLIGLVSVGIAVGVYAVTGRGSLWGITGGESKIGGHLYKLLGLPVESLTYYQQFKLVPVFSDAAQTIVLAILLGGALPALLSGQFLLRHLPNRWMLLQAVAGGFLLGYGSRLALGCNIGNFLSAWTAAGINAITFTAALLVGVFGGLKITERIFMFRARAHKFSYLPPTWLQRVVGAVLALLGVALIPFLPPLVAVFWAAGIALGVLGTFSGICFGSCYRDLVKQEIASWVNVKAIGIILLTFSTGIYVIQLLGIPVSFGGVVPNISQIQIALGGLIFGVGIALAGSCIYSTEWRAGSGSIYSMTVLLSTIFLGMPTLALHYDFWRAIIPPILPSFSLYTVNPTLAYLLPLGFSLGLITLGISRDTGLRQTLTNLKIVLPTSQKH